MKNYKRILCYFLVGGLSFLLLLSACKGNKTIGFTDDEPLSLEGMDTVKILASTVIMDSLPTSNLGVIMLGSVQDKDFGNVEVSSYMQFSPGFAAEMNLPANAKFDSIALVLRYNGYYLGDTTTMKEIRVHRLTENIKLRTIDEGSELEERPVFVDEEALYSTSKFDYETQLLGKVHFKPRPRSKDSLFITLDQQLGKELLKLIGEKDKKAIQKTEFLEYFKGVFMTTANGKNISGFAADSSKIQIYYHYESEEGSMKNAFIAYTFDSKNTQFNHIAADRSGTNIKDLGRDKKELDIATTKGQLFVQGGLGIVTKLLMPGLNAFVKEPGIAINKAELIIETAQDTYSTFPAPEELILFIANSSNTPKTILPEAFVKKVQHAKFQKGNDAGLNGRYVFQLTEYVNQLRKGQHQNTSLLISLPIVAFTGTVNRLHIVNNKPGMPIKLRVVYTKF